MIVGKIYDIHSKFKNVRKLKNVRLKIRSDDGFQPKPVTGFYL